MDYQLTVRRIGIKYSVRKMREIQVTFKEDSDLCHNISISFNVWYHTETIRLKNRSVKILCSIFYVSMFVGNVTQNDF